MLVVVRSVCPGYTQALACAAALLFGFRGVCEGRCVPAIAGLSPSCVSRREVGVSWVYPGSRLCGCAPVRVQGGLRGLVCPGYSRALAFLFLSSCGRCVLVRPWLSSLLLRSFSGSGGSARVGVSRL